MDIDNPRDLGASGLFEARYLAFLETITNLRTGPSQTPIA